MSVVRLRERVMAMAGRPMTPALLCITGASGAGKTTAVRALRGHIERRVLPAVELDMLGVPSIEEMQAAWESPRGWQKAMTWHWVHTARHVYRTQPLVVLEGSLDPQYAIAACAAHRMRCAVVLLDATDDVRASRLAQRGSDSLHPAADVGSEEMCRWAAYLREQAQQLGGLVIDACAPVDHVVDAVCAHAVALVDSLAEELAQPTARTPRGPRRVN